ncbi:MAG: AgmX/PglI C-terminal domain-containing protein [Myxococcales bacterium]|nr:AgmX/PglI C-terminal domain-containing protein [Myxococcales bacterium]
MKRVLWGMAALGVVACGGGTTTEEGFDGEETAGGEEPACVLAETPIADYRLPVLPAGYDLLEDRHRAPFEAAQEVLTQTAPEMSGEATDASVQAYYDGPYTEFLATHREALVAAETALNELSDETEDVRVVASTVVALMYYHLADEMMSGPLPPRVAADPALAATYLAAIEHGVAPLLDTVTDRAEYCVQVAATSAELDRWRIYCFAMIGHAVMQAHRIHSLIHAAEEESQATDYVVRRWGAPRAGTSLGAHAQVEGALHDDEVAHYVVAHETPLLACYHRALEQNERLHGQIVVSFDIASDGATSNVAETVSTLGDADLSACIRNVVDGFTFPAPSEGTAHASVALDLRVIPVPNEEAPEGGGGPEAAAAPPAETE